MSILVDCPACTRKLRVPDDLLGAKVKCPTCGGTFDAGGDGPNTSEARKTPEESPTSAPPPSPASDDAAPTGPTPRPMPDLTIPPMPAAQIKLTLEEDVPPRPASDRPPPYLPIRRPRGPDYDEDD